MRDGPVLIVGASRGIGAELTRQYLAVGREVHATVRDVAAPGELAEVTGPLTLHRLDVRDVAATESVAEAVADIGLSGVIHNAGIYRGHTRAELMEVNAVAPIRMIEALLAVGALGEASVVALITSQMGARRGSSGSLGDYGDSKAALNDAFRQRAAAWAAANIIGVVIHPGWVRTDMGGPGAAIGVAESATGIRTLLSELTDDHHGRFWTWDGREHAW